MIDFLSTLPNAVSAHPDIAYVVVFLLAMSESIPLIGVVVPGTAVIIGIAALVPRGDVGLWPLLVAASLGAILSDGLSFWLGRRYQSEILQHWPFSRYSDLMARSEAFFKRHGGKSVFLARFTPGIRAFVPLTAGILKMPVRQFYMANVLSALVWAPAHTMPGVFVGTYVHVTGHNTELLTAIAIAVFVIIWIAARVVAHTRRRRVTSENMNSPPVSCDVPVVHSPLRKMS